MFWPSSQEKFPGAPDEVYGACLGRLVFHRYINPALMWVPGSASFWLNAKRTQLSWIIWYCSQDHDNNYREEKPCSDFKSFGTDHQWPGIWRRQTKLRTYQRFREESHPTDDRLVLRRYVYLHLLTSCSETPFPVANVSDAETQFHAHEFMDATVQPKPIYISPNEIYNIHSLLIQHQNFLVRSRILCHNLLVSHHIFRDLIMMTHWKSYWLSWAAFRTSIMRNWKTLETLKSLSSLPTDLLMFKVGFLRGFVSSLVTQSFVIPRSTRWGEDSMGPS